MTKRKESGYNKNSVSEHTILKVWKKTRHYWRAAVRFNTFGDDGELINSFVLKNTFIQRKTGKRNTMPFARYLINKRGIVPECIDPNSDAGICSIGFCEKDKKWYGWSHRGIFGFGIGSTVKKGDCAYTPKYPEELLEELNLNEDTNFEVGTDYVKVAVGYVRSENECTCKVAPATLDGKPECTCNYNPNIFIIDPTTGKPKVEYEWTTYKCGRGEWTAKTLEDAKEMAIDYARSIS